MRSDTGRFAETDDFGFVSVDVTEREAATAYHASVTAGRHLSLGLLGRRLLPEPRGVSARARASGSARDLRRTCALPRARLTGSAGAGLARRILVRGPIRPNDWRRVQLGGPLRLPTLPRITDPAVTSGLAYDLGVPVPSFSVSAVEGVHSLGCPDAAARRLRPRARERKRHRRRRATSLSMWLLDQPLRLRSILQGLDTNLASTDLRFALGLDLGRRSRGRAARLRTVACRSPAVTTRSSTSPRSARIGPGSGPLSVQGVSAGVTRSQLLPRRHEQRRSDDAWPAARSGRDGAEPREHRGLGGGDRRALDAQPRRELLRARDPQREQQLGAHVARAGARGPRLVHASAGCARRSRTCWRRGGPGR